MKRAQGSFEYILLLGGILLIVVVAIVMLRGNVGTKGGQNIDSASCRAELSGTNLCFTNGVWDGNNCPSGGGCIWSQTMIRSDCYTGTSSAFANTAFAANVADPSGSTEFICTPFSP